MSDPRQHTAGLTEAGTTADPATMRHVLGHFPTGVTIVTAQGALGPVGLSVNSFTSVSLTPPLVAFFPAHTSGSWPVIRAAGTFCVNILDADAEPLARRFATPGADRFRDATWQPAPHSGAPLLADALAWVDCTVEATMPTGDHDLVLGRVVALGSTDGRDPLLFHRGNYRTLS